MKICPITYQKITGPEKYSQKGLAQLSSALKTLHNFRYTAEEQRKEAEARSSKLSIQGIQPKLSAALNIKKGEFELVDRGGRYILKPQVERYKHLPENEDVTMRLATAAGIEIPVHGMIYSKDGSFTYFIRRFDRKGQRDKIHVEDFAQLSGASRDTKYRSSMERVAEVIEDFCTFPEVEKLELFKRTIFSFLVGNEDMHLKNLSIIVRNDKVELSPAYDFVNSTLALENPKEELALPIRAKKRKITQSDLIDYFALERLKLTKSAIDLVIQELRSSIDSWNEILGRCFLPEAEKKKYLEILRERTSRLGFAKVFSLPAR